MPFSYYANNLGGENNSSYNYNRRLTSRGRHSKSTLTIISSIMLAISLIVSFIGLINIILGNNKIEQIKENHQYYQNIIDHAKADSKYCVDGYINGRIYDEDCKKWYFTYYIIINQLIQLDGQSLPIYTAEEVSSFAMKDIVRVAVDEYPINILSDTIPMNHDGIDLNRDGYYIKANNQKATGTKNLIYSAIALVVSIIMLVIGLKKQNKNTSTKSFSTPSVMPKIIDPIKRCSYCGTVLNDTDKECPSCGAKR